MSVSGYVRLFSNGLDARNFVLGIRICGIDIYIRDGDALRLSVAGGWASW